jgi:hypothetical protein
MEDRKKALTDMMSADEKLGLYMEKFKKESKEIFNNEVKPQIERAMKMEKQKDIMFDWDNLSLLTEIQTPVEWLFYKLWHEPKDKFTWHSLLKKAKEKEEKLKDFETWKEWKNKQQ